MADFLALRIPVIESRELEAAFSKIKDQPISNVWEEYGVSHIIGSQPRKPQPIEHRKQLDQIVFDELKLTHGERDAVYEAVIESVEARLTKAESLNPKAITKRVQAAEKTRGIWAGLPEEDENGED